MYDQYHWMDFEMFDDNETMEVCCVCLRLRVASNLWIRPDEHILSLMISLKKDHILSICWDCLEEIYSGRIKL